MLEVLKIKIWGFQPVAKLTESQLIKLIERDFTDNIDIVKFKLNKIISDTQRGKNRIAAAIIKLSNKDIKSLDKYIEIANSDSRDIIVQAEYPRFSKLSFEDIENIDITEMKKIYLDDWREYSKWLKN